MSSRIISSVDSTLNIGTSYTDKKRLASKRARDERKRAAQEASVGRARRKKERMWLKAVDAFAAAQAAQQFRALKMIDSAG